MPYNLDVVSANRSFRSHVRTITLMSLRPAFYRRRLDRQLSVKKSGDGKVIWEEKIGEKSQGERKERRDEGEGESSFRT